MDTQRGMQSGGRAAAGLTTRNWAGVLARGLMRLAVAMMVVALPLSCTTKVSPPRFVAEPTPVFLLDHGRTPSIVLPDAAGGMIRYTYGEWDYYALRKTGPLQTMAAVLWPTQGALGRRAMPGPPTAANVRQQVRVGIEGLHELAVEREQVDELRYQLEALYRDNLATEVVTPSVDLSFVHHPEAYCALHNSNHEIATWLRDLGCRTQGITFYSNWRVAIDAPRRLTPASR